MHPAIMGQLAADHIREMQPLGWLGLGCTGEPPGQCCPGPGSARVSGSAPAGGSIRLVGREGELRELRSVVCAVTEGAGAVVLVEGDPGIGKSRLVAEVRSASDVLWLRGRSVETRDAAGYRPFAEQIRSWAGPEASWDALVSKALDQLAATRLVERAGRDRYRFAHALTREAVYEGIPLAERRRLHQAAAGALADVQGPTASSLPAIAYHLT